MRAGCLKARHMFGPSYMYPVAFVCHPCYNAARSSCQDPDTMLFGPSRGLNHEQASGILFSNGKQTKTPDLGLCIFFLGKIHLCSFASKTICRSTVLVSISQICPNPTVNIGEDHTGNMPPKTAST